MTITQALRSLQGYDRGQNRTTPGPIFKRQQAEDWLYYQDQLVRRVLPTVNNLNSPEGVQLTQRPFRVQWFIRQLDICLNLWNHDRSLDDALKVGKRLLSIVETMNSLWDCPTNTRECAQLRGRLSQSCSHVGLEEPQPSSYMVPNIVNVHG
ncbi:hypothetical protein FA15DRAFT_412701 [Coprinopsis marcescibilis]|uniref:Uncharacterized protein n=1 Tax=Coprinopsis marcescibilis TaxID=230819 RepID=A0A5C3K9C1_COPMA|nr:hypothetical protein FA15DRAFT_412701 [Coprinopsis marcescibilis]